MDYEKIIDSVGSKEFWNKYSELKKSLISALANAETGEKQCNLPVVSGHVPEDIQVFLHRLRLAEHPKIRKEAVKLFERHCR